MWHCQCHEVKVKELTGPRYFIHCFCNSHLVHFSRFTSFPSPTSNLFTSPTCNYEISLAKKKLKNH